MRPFVLLFRAPLSLPALPTDSSRTLEQTSRTASPALRHGLHRRLRLDRLLPPRAALASLPRPRRPPRPPRQPSRSFGQLLKGRTFSIRSCECCNSSRIRIPCAPPDRASRARERDVDSPPRGDPGGGRPESLPVSLSRAARGWWTLGRPARLAGKLSAPLCADLLDAARARTARSPRCSPVLASRLLPVLPIVCRAEPAVQSACTPRARDRRSAFTRRGRSKRGSALHVRSIAGSRLRPRTLDFRSESGGGGWGSRLLGERATSGRRPSRLSSGGRVVSAALFLSPTHARPSTTSAKLSPAHKAAHNSLLSPRAHQTARRPPTSGYHRRA